MGSEIFLAKLRNGGRRRRDNEALMARLDDQNHEFGQTSK